MQLYKQYDKNARLLTLFFEMEVSQFVGRPLKTKSLKDVRKRQGVPNKTLLSRIKGLAGSREL